MTSSDKFFITTPIYYTNGEPHLGHVFEVVGIDIQARYQRMVGRDVFFLTGTDEHGQKNAEAAAKNGLTPQQWVDRISQLFRDMFDQLEISYDDFIRTTEPRHYRGAQKLWEKSVANGDIYLGKYEG